MTNSNSLTDRRDQRFQSLALLTIIIIYLLILAGGIVRSTGSGMGCPDWPKCFGQWIPPTELAQLPADYQAIYGAKLKGEVEFNAAKTWIEYVNRLLGVLAGFFVLATLVSSLAYWRENKPLVWGSFSAFILVGLNGWLGSRVVATELAQYMITLHLFLAILVVFALLFVYARSKANQLRLKPITPERTDLRWLLLVLVGMTLVQTLLGTQVRGALDAVIKQIGYAERNNWIGQLSWSFYVHRSFSIVLLGVHLILIYRLRKTTSSGWLNWVPNALLALVISEILTGVVMAYLGVPAVAQPIHLVLAIGIVGLQFLAILILSPTVIINRDRLIQNRLVNT